MSRKTGKDPEHKKNIAKEANYYKLKTQAIKDLVEADESNSPEVSKEELDKYRSGPKFKVADWVKLLFIKFWFAGAVCFFFIWGLSGYMAAYLDTLFVTGIAMGIVKYDREADHSIMDTIRRADKEMYSSKRRHKETEE